MTRDRGHQRSPLSPLRATNHHGGGGAAAGDAVGSSTKDRGWQQNRRPGTTNRGSRMQPQSDKKKSKKVEGTVVVSQPAAAAAQAGQAWAQAAGSPDAAAAEALQGFHAYSNPSFDGGDFLGQEEPVAVQQLTPALPPPAAGASQSMANPTPEMWNVLQHINDDSPDAAPKGRRRCAPAARCACAPPCAATYVLPLPLERRLPPFLPSRGAWHRECVTSQRAPDAVG